MQLFSLLITWRSPSSKSAAVYKITWKLDDFSLRYGDRFSKWRPSAILELFCHHTRPPTKSLLLAAATCQISCQSDTQIWRYSYLNFSHSWLEMPVQAPKNWGLGERWTPEREYSSSRPPTGTSLRKSASFKLSTVNIRWGVWPVGEFSENVTDTQTDTTELVLTPLTLAGAVSRGIGYRVRAAKGTHRASYCHQRQTENGHDAALTPLHCH